MHEKDELMLLDQRLSLNLRQSLQKRSKTLVLGAAEYLIAAAS